MFLSTRLSDELYCLLCVGVYAKTKDGQSYDGRPVYFGQNKSDRILFDIVADVVHPHNPDHVCDPIKPAEIR